MIRLTLAYPPSVNTIWRRVGSRTLLSAEGRAYRQTVADAVMLAGVRRGFTSDQRLRVTLLACPPDRRRRDLDNLPKALFDALTHAGVWADDSQVDSLTINRMEPVRGGSVLVTVEVMA